MYNLTNITDGNNIYDITVAVNNMSGGILGSLILFTIFMVFFVSLKQYEGDIWSVLIASSAITSVLAVLMWVIGFIGVNVLIWPLLCLIAFIVGYMLKG